MTSRIQSFLKVGFLPVLTLLILFVAILIYLPIQASPTTNYTVNSTADTDDGTCNAANCTLREAINAANSGAGADSITFSVPPSATIALAGTPLPMITDTLTVDGSTAVNLTISGENITRTFNIASNVTLTITNLVIQDGKSDNNGGGIFNSGTLILLGTNLNSNGALFNGGGIYNAGGMVNIVNSAINSNGNGGNGGGIYNSNGLVRIDNSTVNSNYNWGGTGGGIYNSGGNIDIINTILSGNFGNSGGGGIDNAGGKMNIINSTLSGNNTFFGSGGGIFNTGVITLSNSTFSGNYCVAYHGTCYGGGIYGGTLHISSSTFSGNSAGGYPGPPPYGGGIYGGIVTMNNTIIANSGGGDCVGTPANNVNNLVEDGSCNPTFTGDPLLGPLQDNGGPTLTHAPFSFSPVIDKGDNAACAAPPVNNLDQRGVTRPIDGDGEGTPRCDIGAYEYDGPPSFRFLFPVFFRP